MVKKISKELLAFAIITTVFCLLIPCRISAEEVEFSANFNKVAAAKGENIKFSFSYNGTESLGALTAKLFYSENLNFVKAEKQDSSLLLEYSKFESSINSVLAFKEEEIYQGELIIFTFTVNENSTDNFATINLQVDDVVDSEGNLLDISSQIQCDLEISSAPSDEARLLNLLPSYGELTENFSPDVYSYSMTVPYSIKQIFFEAEVAEGARYAVNRKNLGSGGSTSTFLINVTAADNETKQEYRVEVYREEYIRQDITVPETNAPYLISLYPGYGEFNEEFEYNKYTYTMEVPY